MDATKSLPFGTVVRRGLDGVTVMILGIAKDFMEVDEMHVRPGAAIGLVLDRGTWDDPEHVWWPLLGTCSITNIQNEQAVEWEILP